MKLCSICGEAMELELAKCPKCGSEPLFVGGFESHAPEFAYGGGGFKASYFADLARMEQGHFWFRSRNELILWALKKYVPDFRSFLEIGCGTGYVLAGIAQQFAGRQLHGSEIFVAGLDFAAGRLPLVKFMQIDARRMPFKEEFDAIGAFDVLEHIEEDRQVLSEAHKALRPGGVLCLTVPQHPWLWSSTDSYALHIRRYARRELHEKVLAAGFEILRSTSFVTGLLPAMILSRLLGHESREQGKPDSEFMLPQFANTLLYRVMRADLMAIRTGFDLPAGGSRLVVARRTS